MLVLEGGQWWGWRGSANIPKQLVETVSTEVLEIYLYYTCYLLHASPLQRGDFHPAYHATSTLCAITCPCLESVLGSWQEGVALGSQRVGVLGGSCSR